MKTKRKLTTHADYRFQISISGFDAEGRDVMLVVRADDETDFGNAIDSALGICPLTAKPNGKPGSVAANGGDKQPPPAPAAAAAKCPRCGSECYDNRTDPERGNRPLIKCKKCSWRLWENPRNDAERADNALWEKL